MSWFQAANAGTMAYAMLTLAAGNLIRKHGTAEQVEQYAVPMSEGRWFGTMMLSEPHAGSNLADITTRAEPQADGTYRIFGRKMWISGGDHEMAENIVHLVLARTPGAPAGTKGISLFLVPKVLVNDDGSLGERNDLTLAGINHKMGFRGTVNTAPVLGDGVSMPGGAAGAVGYLIGTENRGMPLMFSMMNEARIGVGLCAASLGYTGYLESLAYARDRLQGRPIGADPTTPQVLLIEHPDVRRMLLAQKAYVEGALALVLLAARLYDDAETAADEADRDFAAALLGLLTPIVKSWPSQYGPAANDLAIQVLGGAGYTRDHEVEQHYRDNRLNSIHEGTYGIQAMDLLGRKVLLDGGKAFALLIGRIQATAERARSTGPDGTHLADLLAVASTDLVATTAHLATLGDPGRIMADATAYLEATGHVVVAWIWLDQWLAAHGKEGSFYDGKRAAATFFFTRELPKVGPMLALLRAADGLTLDLNAAVL
jgi:butyryl-CoA dehydrogenase